MYLSVVFSICRYIEVATINIDVIKEVNVYCKKKQYKD